MSVRVRSRSSRLALIAEGARIFDQRPLRLRELGGAVVGLLAILGVVMGPSVSRGELLHDDWSFNSIVHFAPSWSDAFATMRDNTGHRVVGAFYLATLNRVLGTDGHLFYAWILVLSLVVGVLVFAVVRRLGVAALPAFAMSALVLLLPIADSVRLWIAAAGANVAVTLFLMGLLLALAGLRREGRQALAFHLGALVFFVLSILHYEIAAGAVAACGLLYLTQAPWRAVWRWWVADIVVAAAAAYYVVAGTPQPTNSGSGDIDHLHMIFTQGFTAVLALGNPVGPIRLPIWLLGLVIVAGIVAARMSGDRDALRALTWMAGGAIALAASYVVFIPAGAYYSPASPGIANRVNTLAALGYVSIVFGFVALLSTLVFRGITWHRQLAAGICVLALAAVGWNYWTTFRGDRSAYEQSWGMERSVLDALRAHLRAPPSGTTLFAVNTPGMTAENVPVFGASWDLTGAIQLLWSDPTLAAIPQSTLQGLRCGEDAVLPLGPLYGAEVPVPYRAAVFVDGQTGKRIVVDDAASCNVVGAGLTP